MNSLFVSTHFDDAVFSCGKLIGIIENPTVLTIFGGMPKNSRICTAYDQKSGFDTAKDAVLARRDEDASALALLGAKQKYLDFTDNQYAEKYSFQDLQNQVIEQCEGFDEIYMPVGFMHPDHENVGTLIHSVINKYPDATVTLYMDMPYLTDNPEMAIDRLRGRELKVDYIYRGGELGKKMSAIACYKSQLGITNLYNLMSDERYYVVKT